MSELAASLLQHALTLTPDERYTFAQQLLDSVGAEETEEEREH